MLKLFGKRLLVQYLPEKNETAEAFGIDADEIPSCAKGRIDMRGDAVTLPVQVGDVIYFRPFVADKISDTMYLVEQDNVLAEVGNGDQ